MLMLVVIAVVVLCYYGGGKYCPKVLRDNKEMLLGVVGGLVLCSFFGLRMEGVDNLPPLPPLEDVQNANRAPQIQV